MTKKVEIIIGDYPNNVSLDLTSDSVSIALQYGVDDIRKVETKNTNHSKTVELAGTKKNNIAFGGLFDVNSTFDKFNPNNKVSARILVDSSLVLEGYIRLKSISNLNDKISYSVVVIDNTASFFQLIGDKELRDLDFSSSNHVYNKASIENAWNNHDFNDVYQYPLLDKEGGDYYTSDFKPAFYHKAILKKIANEVGFNLTGSFITDNGDYEKEIIGWDGEEPTITDSQALEREFKSGFSSAERTVDSFTKDYNTPWSTLSNYEPFNYDTEVSDTYNLHETNQVIDGLTGSVFSPSNSGKYNIKIKQQFTIRTLSTQSAGLRANADNSIIASGSEPRTYISASLRKLSDNSEITEVKSEIGRMQSFSSAQQILLTNDCEFLFSNIKIKDNESVYVAFNIYVDREVYWINGTTVSPISIELKTSKNLTGGGLSYWENETVKNNGIVDGDNVELNQYLPKDIKQVDIFKDLIKRYNLYYTTDPIEPNTLVLQTRDNYYNNPTVLDWTQKKDYNTKDNTQFLPELQNKEMLLTYKDDTSNKWSKSYNLSTGDVYGQKKLTFNNDFATGVKKIESIFTSPPLVFKGKEGEDVVVPSVSTEKGKRVPSLLYWGGLIPSKNSDGIGSIFSISWGIEVEGETSTITPTNYINYPYAGHWDNPYSPTLDINFDTITYEYYGILLNSATNNNLFNTYWRNQTEQISTGKLITSKFYLKETDINFIKDNLNSRIFIKDSYYIINKIIDYKPLEDGLTTVELLKMDDIPALVIASTVINNTKTISDSWSSYLDSINFGWGGFSRSNNVNSREVSIVGRRNYIAEGVTGTVNGDNNTIGGNSTSISLQGSNNTVSAGLSNVSITGDNITVTESNTTVIGDIVMQNGLLSSSSIRKEVELNIGVWDMDAGSSATIVHGLSATEWLTVKNVSTNIFDDNLSAIFSFTDYDTCEVFVTSGVFVLQYSTSTKFDSVDFNDATMNRGTVSFNYIPD